MRKKVVVNINKDYCVGCTQTTCSGTLYDFLCCCIEDKEYTKEQVPETFEEIKQLLHNDKKVFNKSVKKIEISEFMIEIHFKLQTICFLHNGDVVEPNCLKPIVTGRTPQQMWNIIKSFIGEE